MQSSKKIAQVFTVFERLSTVPLKMLLAFIVVFAPLTMRLYSSER